MTQAVYQNALKKNKIGTNIFKENHYNPKGIVTPPDTPSSLIAEKSSWTTTTEANAIQKKFKPLPTSKSNPQSLKLPKK